MANKVELINPPELGKASGFSHGVKTPAGGPLLFIAGQIATKIAANGQGKIASADFGEQFSQALANLLTVLRAAGGQPDGLVRLTIYVLDKQEYVANLKKIGEAYRTQIGRHYPAMTLVEVKGLLEPGAKLELEATAAL